MLYAILCYDSEDVVGSWTKEQDNAVMAKLDVVQTKLAKEGRLGPVARLMPTTSATTLRKGKESLVIDGPFAETKELIAGFWLWQVKSMDEAVEWLKRAPFGGGTEVEIRPVFDPADFAPSDPTGELRAAEERLRTQMAAKK
jgi:hypothetical protein